MHMKACGNVYVCLCGIRLCSLGALKRLEFGRCAFKIVTTEHDGARAHAQFSAQLPRNSSDRPSVASSSGRENPFSYMWSEYVAKTTQDRYEKVYYPVIPDGLAPQLAIKVIAAAIKTANRLMCDAVGAHVYVSRLEVGEYVHNPSQVEQVVDNTIVPGVEKLSTGVRDSVSSLWGMATGRAQRPSSARPSGRHTLGDD